jgi:internalin A
MKRIIEALPEEDKKQRRKHIFYMIFTVFVAVLIIVVAVVLRNASDARNYNSYMEQAQQSMGNSDYDSALSALRKAASIDKTDECLLLMVDCYETQGNYTKALEILRSMNTSDPDISSRITTIDRRRQLLAEAESVTIAGIRYPGTTTSLTLDNMGLTEAVLEEIANLHTLDTLSLANNSITDISDIADMAALVSLNLSGNNISDLSPLSSLSSLRVLTLDGNKVTDLSPLLSLQNLTSLSIRGMDVSEGQLEALTKALPNCAIHSDTDPNETAQDISFGGITFKADIEELNLSGMNLRDISAISACTQLKKLNISNNQISDLSPLMNLPSLEWLDISDNSVTDLRPLMGLSSLTYINAAGNSINSTTALSMMNGIKELYLDNNPVKDFSGIRKVKTLEILGLSNTGLTDEAIEYLEKLTLLSKLDITDNSSISGEAVDDLKQKLPSCSISHSELAYSIDLDGHSVLTNATSLDLSGLGISNISNLTRLSYLESLNLSRNEISNIYIFQLTNSRYTLKELNLSGNQIEDITPIASLQYLEVLDLSNNLISSELPLMNLTNLKTLYLGGNQLTEAQLDKLQNSLTNCDIILD